VAAPVDEESSEAMVAAVERRVEGMLSDGKYVVTLGGEHTVSVGAARACARKYPGMSVLQLDAHADLREEYEGTRFSHACAIARIREFAPQTVAVGIRSLDLAEKALLDPRSTFYAHQIRGTGEWVPDAVERLSDDVYVTIDLDVFDPSLLPATGTPEPGGMGWYQVLDLLREVVKNRRVVGFDVVELSPNGHKPSEFLAAKLVYVLLSYISAFGA
jgi:agmatinase